MKSIFLTSNPTGPLDGSRACYGLDEMNGFAKMLRERWKSDSKCLIISATPDSFSSNDSMRDFFWDAFGKTNLSISKFDVLDNRWRIDKAKLNEYDCIILGGGHVPTQNNYFTSINLKEMISDYEGIIIGISAGSMNSSNIVYVQPELEGEAINPNFIRFTEGLGLTDIMIIPHYQVVKNIYLDGMRLYEDITYKDSIGHVFLTLEDGSFLLIENGNEIIYGNAYAIADGEIYKVCDTNDYIIL